MKSRNSGLGCGCSSGPNDRGMGLLYPASAPVAKPSYPMTATLTTGRQSQAVAPLSPAQVWKQFFREGIAFGAAWTASLEQGRTVPAQWHHDMERAAAPFGVPLSPTGAMASNRDAFVAGFDLGIRIVMERRSSFRAPNGRVYTLDFLRTQGTVTANTLFGQTRPAVLPEITAAPTGMAPAAPGTVTQMSTYDQFMGIARSAIAANLASALSSSVTRDGSGFKANRPPFAIAGFHLTGVTVANPVFAGAYRNNNPAAVWILFLMGNRGSLVSAEVPRTLDRNTYNVVREWARVNQWLISGGHFTGPYLQAILNTTWVPQSNAGGTYYTGVSNCGPGEVRNPDGSCTRLR